MTDVAPNSAIDVVPSGAIDVVPSGAIGIAPSNATDDLIALAHECGFETACPLEVSTLHFMPEVRAMCAADKCHNYNKCWTCPPAAGDLDELSARCRTYTAGLLVQTIGKREDEFDFDSIVQTQEQHAKSLALMTSKMRGRFTKLWPLGTGTCTRCKTCTWPDAPCRFPEDAFPSMEACGLLVSQICADNGLGYYYGPDSISFTACYLFCI